MTEDKKARKPHLTLRQPDFPIAAELLALLETMTATGAITDAGLRDARVGVGARRVGDPFTVLIASGQKPESTTKTAKRRSGS